MKERERHLFPQVPCSGVLLGSEVPALPANLVRLVRSCVGLAAEVCGHLGKGSLALDLFFNPSTQEHQGMCTHTHFMAPRRSLFSLTLEIPKHSFVFFCLASPFWGMYRGHRRGKGE